MRPNSPKHSPRSSQKGPRCKGGCKKNTKKKSGHASLVQKLPSVSHSVDCLPLRGTGKPTPFRSVIMIRQLRLGLPLRAIRVCEVAGMIFWHWQLQRIHSPHVEASALCSKRCIETVFWKPFPPGAHQITPFRTLTILFHPKQSGRYLRESFYPLVFFPIVLRAS